ncbi:MAG: ester cyclase [Gemmatimonadales bacterium]
MRRLGLIAAAIVLTALISSAARNRAKPASPSAVLEAYVHAWNQHDSAAFDTLFAPDGVHEDLAQGFTGRGSSDVKGFLRELLKVEPDFRWQLTSVFERGPNVAGEWTWRATYTGPGPSGPVTARPISGRGVSLAVIERGRIKRFTDYYDAVSFFTVPADSTHH